VKITPAHLELITQQVSADEASGMTRVFVIGGENLTAESLRFWREAAPTTRLINEYGPTETVVGCCVHEVGTGDPQNGSVPIGRPIANTELYVLDETRQPVPVGAMGELYIGGAGVARGYLNRPELTRERFLPDPFSGRADARLYKTGDLARYRPDGILEYMGRVDDQVKIRGYRIELGEIEGTLAGQPQVQSCAVIVREDSPGNKQLVGYLVAQKNASCSADDVRTFLQSRLPDYMVPAHFVFLETLPLTQNGKVDRRALPAPTYADASVTQDYVAPRNDLERSLVAIWAELLALGRIGIRDDVFELGATSLMVLGAVARIRSTIGVDIDMQLVFEHPTVADLARALGALDGRGLAKSDSAATSPGPAAEIAPPAAAEATAGLKSASSEPHVIPIRFGRPGQELVGLYQRPSVESDRRECFVLCNPFGQEAMRSHRVYRILADRLARVGFHVMRFDYFGTGDSSGEDQDGTLDHAVDDVIRADEELSRRSGCTRSAWFGLRLGATVAMMASSRAQRMPTRLVLWDPVVDGSAYLAELAVAHIAARSAPFELRWEIDAKLRARVADEARNEALGYRLTQDFQAQLGGVSIASLGIPAAERIELVTSGARKRTEELRSRIEQAGTAVRAWSVEANVNWAVNEMLSDSIVPPTDFRTLFSALTE
jgi:pimeloyl-ACP methyl ester carboxylesterase